MPLDAMTGEFVSYAQNFEDVMLWRALKDVRDGWYVDVGAYSPTVDSVTKAFYDRGWHGLNIEANKDLLERFRVDRPRDVNLNVAVGDRVGETILRVVSNAGLSTVSEGEAVLRRGEGYGVEERPIRMETLSTIWEQHVPTDQAVHFLKVDVEGLEREVLIGNDWRAHRPWVVLAEATQPMSAKPTYLSWEAILLDHAYRFVYADGLNRFYVAAEHSDLEEAFAVPPNWFDHFVRASEFALRQRLKTAEPLAAEAARIKASRMWRLTAPLRRADRALRRIRARP
jgi:FkbM family methyltransferase